MSIEQKQGDIELSVAVDDGKSLGVQRSISTTECAEIIDDYGSGDNELRKPMTARHMQMISFGSNIGTGVFIATGKALYTSGPGHMILGYGLIMLLVILVLNILAEMTIAFPISGNFVEFTTRWVDSSMGFSIGFAEWLAWVTIVGSEAVAFGVIVRYWGDQVPEAALMTIFLVATIFIHVMPVQWFAEFEFVTSALKVVFFVVAILCSLAMIGGAGPNGYVHHGDTWTKLPAFKHSLKGFVNCNLLAIWAVGDQVLIGIMAAESELPRYSMARAIKGVAVRVFLLYMVSITLITILVPSDETRLFGASGSAASPFVIAMNLAGINVLPDILNAIMLIGVLAISVESIYIASRVMRSMSLLHLLPKVFAKTDKKGRPTWAVLVSSCFAIIFSYINCSSDGIVVFNWFSSVSSTSFLLVWVIIAIAHLRFRKAIQVQGDPTHVLSGPYNWVAPFYPYLTSFFLGTVILILIGVFYLALFPIGGSPSAYDFFQIYLGVVLLLGVGIGHKLIFRTRWVAPEDADLHTGRRYLTESEITYLDNYYSQPRWRRFLTYLNPT